MKYRILLASPLLFTVAFAAFAAFAFNPFGSTSKSIASQPASISAQPGSNRISKLKTPNNSQTPRGLNQGHVPPVESQGSVLKQQEAGGDRIPPTIIHRTRRDDDETSELYTGFATTSQGVGSLSYHQGPLMLGTTKMYYIWYGNWANNTATTILTDLATNIGGSPYFNINTVYTDVNGTAVSNSVQYGGAITDNYSQGQGTLSDTAIFNIVNSAISSGRLPMDPNAVYFVLTSSDLGQGDSSSSFGKDYCGWHTYATVNNGPSIKYAFIGNPENTPTCTAQSTSSPNGNIGADGMASIIAHELEESVTDPEITAWYGVDAKNNLWENADQCAWTFGSGVYTAANGSKANVKLGNRDFLIQQNWTNTNGCVMSLSGSSTTTTATLTVSSTNPTSGVNITVSPKDNNGAGNGATQFSRTYNVNTNVTLTASASAGSNNFQKWQRDGVDLSTSPQVTVAMDTNHAMTAVYQAAQGYSIGVTASPSSGGTVSGGGTFAAGSSVTVAATASAGYTFSTWTENGNAVVAQNNYTFTVSGSRNLVANFIPTSQARAQMTSPAAGSTFGSGTVTFNWSQVANSTQYSLYVGNAYRSYDIYASYVSGGSTTVSGIPTDGRTIYISLWSFINGIWVPADYTYQAETPTSQGYAINLIASPSAGGTVSGGGTVAPGTSRTVTATANAGYTFSTWSENGNAIVAQNSYMFTVTGNRNLVANFISNSQARAQIT
ncbi:MAG TPA: hypothetical protein VFC63_10150, partial [Blastocatellia bacterium]|nr:hypothetical protein [Blastocatellia bacterium]